MRQPLAAFLANQAEHSYEGFVDLVAAHGDVEVTLALGIGHSRQLTPQEETSRAAAVFSQVDCSLHSPGCVCSLQAPL